jgi:hypothetical protein
MPSPAIRTLEELEPWCLSAKNGDEEIFSVGEILTRKEASNFAFLMNRKRDEGHVWIYVMNSPLAPEGTTRIYIRCSA